MALSRKHTKPTRKNKAALVYAALILILLYATVYEIKFVLGPSYFGDDTVYTYFASAALHGNFVENIDIFSVRLLNIYPITFFYLLLGQTNLGTAGWAITSFIGCIIVAFFIGKELYNEYAGLLAALLLSFYPLFVVLSETPTPNVPEAFLVGLALLALLLARRKNSKAWYFASGATALLSVLTTQLAAIVIPVIFVYLLIEFLRKKFMIDRTSMYLLYGFLAAGLLLVAFNFVTSGNPLITLTTTTNLWQHSGTSVDGMEINQDPMFYFGVMFPYRVLDVLSATVLHGIYDPVMIWQDMGVINYVYVGFFFYAFVLAAAYLIIRRERSAYFPLLWFAVAFLYLEFGPIYMSLVPFQYIITHRLERYLTILVIPQVIIISIALLRVSGPGKGLRRMAPIALSAAAVLFLIATSVPLNLFWHTTVSYETYDQMAIANYLNALPNTTRIAYESGFSIMQTYMGYRNQSRFLVYDQMANCTGIPAGYYVVVPKYYEVFGLNYTDPAAYCPDWKLVLYPQINGTYPDGITIPARVFGAKLYYVQARAANTT